MGCEGADFGYSADAAQVTRAVLRGMIHASQNVFLMKVAADGKTMHVVDRDPVHGTVMTFTAEKQ
jgi:hypothetical protein